MRPPGECGRKGEVSTPHYTIWLQWLSINGGCGRSRAIHVIDYEGAIHVIDYEGAIHVFLHFDTEPGSTPPHTSSRPHPHLVPDALGQLGERLDLLGRVDGELCVDVLVPPALKVRQHCGTQE